MRKSTACAAALTAFALAVPGVAHADPCVDDPNGAACLQVAALQSDLQRLEAERLVVAADRTDGEAAQALFAQGAAAFLAAFREHCETPVAAQRPPHSPLTGCMEMVYNAARAFAAAKLLPNAIATYRTVSLFDAIAKAHSPLAIRATYSVGGLYQSIGIYDQAADAYERYAALDPRASSASTALSDAAILRLGLGDDARAAQDAATFTKLYGAAKRPEAAQLALALASYHAEREAWDRAASVLTSSMSLIDRGPLDLTVRAHAILARAHAKSSTPERAKAEYANIRAMWRDPAAAEAAIRRGWPDEDQAWHDRRLARTLTAVGEAFFAGTEERRIAEVDPLKFPVYAGPFGDRAAILAYVQDKVRPWFEKKRAAIEHVETDYVRILDIKPVPPPSWVIAAAAAVGTMWGDFTDDMRRMPIPDAWRKNPLLLRAYYEGIDEMSETIRARRAKPAMRKCVDLAAKYNVIDPRARRCEAWLARSYKTEFHVVDEIIPGYRAPGVSPVTAPLMR